jgi:putative tryptophan/tyrosine transport system substrate-binding protein
MFIIGIIAYTEDVLGDVTEVRMSLERLGFTVHLEQMGYSQHPVVNGMFEEESLLLWLGRCYHDDNRCREIAEAFVQAGVDLILAMKSPALKAALVASEGTNLPVIFTHISDPIVEGVIPDQNGVEARVTGVKDIWLKCAEERLFMLNQIVPTPNVIHIFYNPVSPTSNKEVELLKGVADGIKIELSLHPAQKAEEVRNELSKILIYQDHALMRTADPLFDSVSGLLGATAHEKYIPYVGLHIEEMERCGALFVLDQRGIGSQAAWLVKRILEGENPGRIPAIEPERRIFGVNLQSSLDLGLVVAPVLLQKAQVIIHERERTSLGARLLLGVSLVMIAIISAALIAAYYGISYLIDVGGIAIVFSALFIWFYLNQHIIRPIRKLTLVAEKIGAGDLDVEIGEARVEDEIGVLSRTFRRMRSNLKYSQTELERLNINLKQQIFEQTATLRQVQEMQQELKLANRRLVEADDCSRFALTTYIHDEILIPLGDLKARAYTNSDLTLVELANQVDQSLRRVRFDLSVPILHDMRVELRRLLQEILPTIYPESQKVKLSINLTAIQPSSELDSASSVLFYRFIRGAVSNVYKHAQANHIWVKSSHDNGLLSLSVSDDGIGFDLDQIDQFVQQGHYFFHDIHIRVQQLGGQLKITSQPGYGTTLEISIPVPHRGPKITGLRTDRSERTTGKYKRH